MLDNFQLAAITKIDGRMHLRRIPLHQKLQDALAESWQEQYETFFDDVQEIDFNAGYQPEGHERFCLADFDLPDCMAEETSESVADLDAIGKDEEALDSIRGMVAFARDDQGEEVVLFQNFSRSHVIRPKTFLLLRNNTYETSQEPGLRLDQKLSAVYLPVEGKLLFQSFRIVNTFLPLADFYEEASEEEIQKVLAHERFAPVNAVVTATDANQWFRKRFAMLRDSGVLDKYTAAQIKKRSSGYDVEIQIKQGKIVFPVEKPAAKKLLQFLNEEIFRGAITETLYETNSKREAD